MLEINLQQKEQKDAYTMNADDLDKLIVKVNDNKGKDEIQGELNDARL